jgi:hypothetical protein
MEATTSIQSLRDKRRRAEDWIDYASWTAIVTAIGGSALVLAIGLGDLSSMSAVVPVLSTFFAQGIVGYKMRERSQWAAWALMASYIASFVATILLYGTFSGLLVKLIIGFVYVRGWLGAIDYAELTKQINAATAAETWQP